MYSQDLSNCTTEFGEISEVYAFLYSQDLSNCTTEFGEISEVYAFLYSQDLSNCGSLSTVVGDEKLTSREDRIGPLFMYAQCDEDTFLKVDEVSKTEP